MSKAGEYDRWKVGKWLCFDCIFLRLKSCKQMVINDDDVNNPFCNQRIVDYEN